MRKLPEAPGFEWPERTRKFWRSLSSVEGSEDWTAADWEQLATIAIMHARIWGAGEFDLIPRLQRLLAAYGITPAAREELQARKPARVEKEEESENSGLDKELEKLLAEL